MLTDGVLRGVQEATLDVGERRRLERAIVEVREVAARTTTATAGVPLHQVMLLLDGLMCRFIDDRKGFRQLVAIHVPGDFVDLHAFPLRYLDHHVATMTKATVALIPHAQLHLITTASPALAQKLWFATLIDAAIHRAWLFRLGRLDAVGRVAHFLCETNVRLTAAGLSDGRRFALDLRQSDLADICSLTSIHVNRVLRQLRDERLCVFRSSWVELLDPEATARRGQFDARYLYVAGNETAGARSG